MNWKNSMTTALAAVLLGALSAGCTVESFPNGSSGFIPSRLSFDSMFAAAQLKCEDPNNCPGNVGLIVFKAVDEDGSPGFGQCTGTLVGEDTVLTASHCLPESVKRQRLDCENEVGFVRSATDRYPQKIRCSEILHFSADFKSTLIDYALFRLKQKATDSPTRISRQGVPDNSRVYSYSVDPNSKTSVQGLMKKKVCQSVMNSIIGINYTHPLSAFIGLVGDSCKLIGGNSGSGMMMNDEIRAVISIGRKNGETKQMFKGKDTPMGGAVNLACRELPRGFSIPGPECRSVPTETVIDSLETTEGIVRHSLTSLQQVVLRAPIYRYRFEILDKRIIKDESNNLMKIGGAEIMRVNFSLSPVCIVPRTYWPSLGIVARDTADGGRAIVASAPKSGDLSITVVVDELTRMSIQSRALNVNDRMVAIPVSTMGTVLPWCSAAEMDQKILF